MLLRILRKVRSIMLLIIDRCRLHASVAKPKDNLYRMTLQTLEHIIVSNINKHLAFESILADCQHGFQSQRSCETQLVQFYHDMVSNLKNRTLGFLRRNLFSCPQDVKEAAYKSLVRPILEYGSTVWDPHYNGLNNELENVQKRAARFVTRNYSYETGSMTGILEELKWETLHKRRKDNRLILLYKGLKGKARIPTDDLIPKNRRCRNQHSLVFQILSASIDAYKKSFFPQSIRDWNVLPDSLISSVELSDDCVSKFTSLVRARD